MSLAYLCLEAPREGVASYVHVHEIISGLRKRGWTVDLVAPSHSGEWRRPGLMARVLQYAAMQVSLAFRFRRYRAVYVRAHPLAFPLACTAKLFGIPLVHEVNGTYGDLYVAYPGARRARRYLDAMQRWQFRWAAGVICVTPQLAQWVKNEVENRPVPVATIPNGANVELFSSSATVSDAIISGQLPEKYVVFFGGLTRWHGIPQMLAGLKTEIWPKDVSLVVIGDGPEAPRLAEAAASDSRIVLLGRLPYTTVGGIVARAVAGLVPISDPDGRSSSAGLAPLKLYETLACAIPALVSDFPGQADLVREHDCGICFAPDDGEALASAVAVVDADPAAARAMGQRGAAAVRSHHSWDSRARDTSDFLARIEASRD
jgi:glycosyltransferase involved in cell wall biosynthesis